MKKAPSFIEQESIQLVSDKSPDGKTESEISKINKEETIKQLEKLGLNFKAIFFVSFILVLLISSIFLIGRYIKSRNNEKIANEGKSRMSRSNSNYLQMRLYLNSMIKQGYTDNEIRNQLKSSGWPDNLVNKAFKEIREESRRYNK